MTFLKKYLNKSRPIDTEFTEWLDQLEKAIVRWLLLILTEVGHQKVHDFAEVNFDHGQLKLVQLSHWNLQKYEFNMKKECFIQPILKSFIPNKLS